MTSARNLGMSFGKLDSPAYSNSMRPMSSAPLDPAVVGRLPASGDNVAIAVRRLETGDVIAFHDGARPLTHTVLEGHRFAVRPIRAGESLLSWGMPFGIALRDISPGDYVCNQSILDAQRDAEWHQI